MKCPYCDADNSMFAKFCAECGKPLRKKPKSFGLQDTVSLVPEEPKEDFEALTDLDQIFGEEADAKDASAALDEDMTIVLAPLTEDDLDFEPGPDFHAVLNAAPVPDFKFEPDDGASDEEEEDEYYDDDVLRELEAMEPIEEEPVEEAEVPVEAFEEEPETALVEEVLVEEDVTEEPEPEFEAFEEEAEEEVEALVEEFEEEPETALVEEALAEEAEAEEPIFEEFEEEPAEKIEATIEAFEKEPETALVEEVLAKEAAEEEVSAFEAEYEEEPVEESEEDELKAFFEEGEKAPAGDDKTIVYGDRNTEEAQEPEAAEEPAVAEPVAEEPAIEEPAAVEPVAEEPAIEEPKAAEPVAEEPATEEPKAEEPVAEEPATEEPTVAEPVKEEPAAEELAAAAVPVKEEPAMRPVYVAAPEEPQAKRPAQTHNQRPTQVYRPFQEQGPAQAQGQRPTQGQRPPQGQGQRPPQGQRPTQAQGQRPPQGQRPAQAQGQRPAQRPVQAQAQKAPKAAIKRTSLNTLGHKIAGVAAIVLGVFSYFLKRQLVDLWNTSGSALVLLSVIVIGAFIACLAGCGLAIKDTVQFDQGKGKEFVKDAFFWLPAVTALFTLLSNTIVKVAYMLLRIAAESYSFEMLEDLENIYNHSGSMSTMLVITTLLGIALCVFTFTNFAGGEVAQSVKSKVSDLGQHAQNIAKHEPSQPKHSAKAGSTGSYIDEIRELKKLLDEGAITQDEYDQVKKKLLGL